MDDLDQRILDLLVDDARQLVTVMARRLHVARSTLQERIARLERNGVIAGYTVRLGPAATGRRVTAHVAITIDPKRGDHVQQTLRRITGVRTLHTVSGPFDLIAVRKKVTTFVLVGSSGTSSTTAARTGSRPTTAAG